MTSRSRLREPTRRRVWPSPIGAMGPTRRPTRRLVAGTDQVDVRVNGTPVAGSPFSSTVVPGPADPSHDHRRGDVASGFFGSTIDVVVTTRDAQGNLLGRGGDLVQMQVDGWTVTDGDRARTMADGTYSRSAS